MGNFIGMSCVECGYIYPMIDGEMCILLEKLVFHLYDFVVIILTGKNRGKKIEVEITSLITNKGRKISTKDIDAYQIPLIYKIPQHKQYHIGIVTSSSTFNNYNTFMLTTAAIILSRT
jgi:hypothetical protein